MGQRDGAGSDFIFTPGGYLLTNSNVVWAGLKQRSVEATLSASFIDGREFSAWWVGDDPGNGNQPLNCQFWLAPSTALG